MSYGWKSAKPAKPKKPAVLAITSRPTRVAKGKGRMIIRTAVLPKPRTSHVSATAHTDSSHNLPSVSRLCSTELTPGGESSDVEESSNNRGTLMEDMIQDSITEALAIQDGKETEGNFATG